MLPSDLYSIILEFCWYNSIDDVVSFSKIDRKASQCALKYFEELGALYERLTHYCSNHPFSRGWEFQDKYMEMAGIESKSIKIPENFLRYQVLNAISQNDSIGINFSQNSIEITPIISYHSNSSRIPLRQLFDSIIIVKPVDAEGKECIKLQLFTCKDYLNQKKIDFVIKHINRRKLVDCFMCCIQLDNDYLKKRFSNSF